VKRLFGRAPLFAALLIALPGLWHTFDATRRASFTSLGRDQGIFQYIAWAVRQGDVLYRDIRDVNGPVVTMVHIAFQWLGGEDEHRFRTLDLLATGLSFAMAGALVASKARVVERLAWALAAWTACSAQYLMYGFWDTAQRESFLDWFVIVSIALWSAADETRSRKGTLLVAAAGLTSFVPWLGKPTFALFTFAQLAALLFERDRKRRLGVFLAGGAVGLIAPFLFLVVAGDLRAWFEIEVRPRLSADSDVFPPPGPTPTDNGLSWSIPSHLLFVSAKGSDGKREYRATGTILRFFEQPVAAISAGVWECRYVLRLAKK
jgi:hypothetical protein